MEATLTLSIITGVLLLLLIISGVRLRKDGEPYKVGVLTGHKIISLAIMVLFGVVVVQHLKEMEIDFLGWLMVILTAVFLLAGLVTGGALTKNNPSKETLKKIHKLATLLTVIMVPLIWIYYH